jgi:hypothetical protein
MKYLYTLPSGPLRPYPRQDDQPVVGLDTTAFAVLLVQQDPEPEYNSDTEYLAPHETITLGEPEGVLRRTWQVLPIPPAPEQAHWVEFGQAVLASAELGQLYEAAPRLLAHGLTAGLLQAVNQTDSRPFAAAWGMARGLGLISDELLAGVLSMAAGFDLPTEFTAALTVPPPAQSVGQEWASPDGTLYRVAQAFDDVGQFLPDDPATPPRESLRWVVVEP